MPSISEINIRIGAKIDGLVKGLRASEKQLNRSARRMTAIGTNLTNSLSLPLAAAGAAGIKFGADLQSSFSKIENLVGITGSALTKLKDGVADLAGPLGATQQSLSDALFAVTSAGARGASALNTLQQASKASAIGLGDTTVVARTATAVVNTYGEGIIDASKAIDQFTAAARVGNFEAAEFAPAIGRVLPLAKTLGISFSEVAANVATFTKAGLTASESVTGLKSLLTSIIKPSKQSKEALATVGLSMEELRNSIKQNGLAATLVSLTKIFKGNEDQLAKLVPNVEGLVNALATAGSQGEDYIANLKQIEESTGIVDQGFKKVSETANFKFKQALVGLQNTLIELGNILIPVATKLIGKFNEIAASFSDLNPTVKRVVVNFGLFLAVLGPSVRLIGATKASIASMKGLMIESIMALKKMRKAFLAMNVVMKATVLGAVAAGVLAMVVAYRKLNEELNIAGKVTQKFAESQVEIQQEYGRTSRRANKLFEVLKDVTASKEDQKKAIKELKQEFPEYLKGIDLEKRKKGDLLGIQDKLNKSILKGIAARKKNEALNAIYDQIVEKQLRIKEIEEQGFDATSYKDQLRQVLDGGFFDLLLNDQESVSKNVLNGLRNDLKRLNKELDTTSSKFDETFDLDKKTKRSRRSRGIGISGSVDLKPENDDDPKPRKQTIISEIKVEASDSIFEERQRVEELTEKLKESGDSAERVKFIFEELKQINDSYFAGLTAGTSSLDAIIERAEGYNDVLTRRGELAIAQERLLEINKKLAAVDLGGTLEEGESVGGLERQREQIKEFITSLESLEMASQKANQSLLSGFDTVNRKVTESIQKFSELVQAQSLSTASAQVLANTKNAVSASFKKFKDEMSQTKSEAMAFNEALNQVVESGLENMAIGVAESLGQVLAGTASIKDVGKIALMGLADMLSQVGKLAITTGIAIGGIRKALESLNPIAAIAGGAALVALASFVKSKLSSSVPALAEGGLASGPTLALVGDNPNARIDPEVISPLSKLRNMMGGQGVYVDIGGSFRLNGTDLVLAVEKTNVKRNRKSR